MADEERERLVRELRGAYGVSSDLHSQARRNLDDYDAAVADLRKGNAVAASGWAAYQCGDYDGGLKQMHDGGQIVGRALAKLEEIRSRKPRGGKEG